MTADKVLALLAYPLTGQLHGTAYVHRLPAEVDEVWARVRARYRERVHANVNLPYAGLVTGLRAYSGAFVNLFPTSKKDAPRQLVASRPLDHRDLRDAVVLWEQAVLGVPDDEITFGYDSELADLVAGNTVEQVSLADHVHRAGNQPDAPNWVYDAATWEAGRRLEARPWKVDGREVTLRVDTDGNLLVWDQESLWSAAWTEGGVPQYAALRVKLSMQTLPDLRTPALVLEPSVAWLSRWLGNTRTAWLASRKDDAPLLGLAVEGWGERTRIEPTSRIALSVSRLLSGEKLLVPDDLDLTGKPRRLRALVPKSARWPVGRGVGMYTIRELSHHATNVLGVPNLTAGVVQGHQFPKQANRKTEKGRDADLLGEESLPAIIEAAGCERLRLLVLYRKSRARVLRLLKYHFASIESVDNLPDDEPIDIGGGVEVVLHHADELLRHGRIATRVAALNRVPHVTGLAGTRVLALCETEYEGKTPDDDAKPLVNRLLAERGVLAQFFATSPETKPVHDPAEDHAGHSALADLMRVAGLVHPRMGRALSHGQLGTKAPITCVGLHVRQQRGASWTGGRPKLSWSLVAMIPNDRHWRILAYQAEPERKTGTAAGWHDYFIANTAFRARPLPGGRRQDEVLVSTIETALGLLQPHVATGAGYVVMVSGDSARSLYPLLANKNLDLEPDVAGRVNDRLVLPGWDPATGRRPLAVVRVTSGSRELPRPVEVRIPDPEAEDGLRIVKTTQSLYQLSGSARTWILSNIPRQFAGGKWHSRAGFKAGRWSGSAELGRHTWYAHTTTEIVVVGADTDPVRYAVAAARLCDHAVSWDGRTSYPVPVHLASLMDRDHPEYRRTIDAEGEAETAQ
ncbi:RNaseH domain-containing protein [Lentzea sp. NPDC034063]|uniref:RNaseH domain-containing protein n=1 Tax=unclassified Lentzea TaxID=2643253 RepID=UPI0033F44E36